MRVLILLVSLLLCVWILSLSHTARAEEWVKFDEDVSVVPIGVDGSWLAPERDGWRYRLRFDPTENTSMRIGGKGVKVRYRLEQERIETDTPQDPTSRLEFTGPFHRGWGGVIKYRF